MRKRLKPRVIAGIAGWSEARGLTTPGSRAAKKINTKGQ
jgi:hypothetical protein